jgi:hypothetical protein
MGTVWRARDEVVERDVAVKEPQVPENLGAAERRTAFLRIEREARAAARIDHPSVVTIHDVVSEGGRQTPLLLPGEVVPDAGRRGSHLLAGLQPRGDRGAPAAGGLRPGTQGPNPCAQFPHRWSTVFRLYW